LLASVFAVASCNKTPDSTEMASNDIDTAIPVDNFSENLGEDVAATASTIDAAFLTDAMKGDNSEVAIGKLAATQATSKAAKDLGTMLAADHGSHKGKLAALATEAGVTATDDPSDEGKANLDKLKALKGAEFDKEFARLMVEDHKKDIAKYEKQAASSDPKTSTLAKDTLPTLRKHLEVAEGL
jgi:putative membrane protein